MNRASLLALCLLGLACSAGAQVSRYVNPMIGTTGMGHCFPGACAPFGAVQLSPDTDTIPHNVNGKYQAEVYNYCAGYQYDDPTIVGFSHTHLSGTGHSDLGDILLMPQTGALQLTPGTKDDPDSGYRQRFRHDTENQNLLEQVFQTFGQYSAWALRNKTHEERPWLEATDNGRHLGGLISRKTMLDYFKENYIA